MEKELAFTRELCLFNRNAFPKRIGRRRSSQLSRFSPPAAMLLEVCTESIDLRRSERAISLLNEISKFALHELDLVLERQGLGHSPTR